MPHTGIRSILILAFSIFGSAFAGVDFRLPEVPTDLDKLRLMMAIQREFPAFLKEGSDYGFDPYRVLEDQQRLISTLSQDPNYVKLMAQRPDLLEIEIKPPNTLKTVKKLSVDPTQVTNWRDSLETTHHEFPDPQSALVGVIGELKKRNSLGMISGLIARLPDGVKQEAFRQPGVQAKLEYLKSSPATTEEIRNALPEVQAVMKLEAKLQRLTELCIALQTDAGVWKTGNEAESRIASLGEAELNQFLDFPHFVKPRLDSLNQSLERLQHHTAVKTSVVESIQEQTKERMAHQVETVEEVKGSIHLKELRAGAGIFRSCAGQDCSTRYSFAVVNNPDELVFAVTDSNGQSKGYLEATRLLVGNKKTLYISSINGPRISSNDVELLLNGLYKILPQFGVEQIALPTYGSLISLVNYKAILTKMKDSVTGSPKVELTFTSPEIRENIEHFKSHYLSMDYDSMKNNRFAQILPAPHEDPLAAITTQVRSRPPEPWILDAELNRAAVIKFLIESPGARSLSAFFNRTLHALQISPEQWRDFDDTLKNKDHKTIAAFYDDLNQHYRRLLQDPRADISLGSTSILTAGRLRASDALAPQNAEESTRLLFSIIKKDKDLFKEVIYHYLEDSFNGHGGTPASNQVLEKLMATEDPLAAEVGTRLLVRFDHWPKAVWKRVPDWIAQSISMPILSDAFKKQTPWPEEAWKRFHQIASDQLKLGREGAASVSRIASVFASQESLPGYCWDIVPEMLMRINEPIENKGVLHDISPNLWLIQSIHDWPDVFWRKIPYLLEHLGWSAQMQLLTELEKKHPPAWLLEDLSRLAPVLEVRVKDRLRDFIAKQGHSALAICVEQNLENSFEKR